MTSRIIFLVFFAFLMVFPAQAQNRHNHSRKETGIEKSVRATNKFLRIGEYSYYCDYDGCRHEEVRNYRDHYSNRHYLRGGNGYAETGRLSLEAFLNYLLQRKQLNIAREEIRLQYNQQSQQRETSSSGEASTLPIAEYFADPANFRQNMNILGIKIYTKDSGEIKLVTTISLGETWKRVAKEYRTVFFKALINTGQEEQEIELKPVYNGQLKYKLALK